jgi:hypothetical protein
MPVIGQTGGRRGLSRRAFADLGVRGGVGGVQRELDQELLHRLSFDQPAIGGPLPNGLRDAAIPVRNALSAAT